jgi:hypothetical protein
MILYFYNLKGEIMEKSQENKLIEEVLTETKKNDKKDEEKFDTKYEIMSH